MKVKEIKTNKFTWVDIEKPTRKKLEELKEKYDFHRLDIEDVLTYTQRPKVEKYKKYLFLIIRFPVYDYDERRFNVSEIDIFVGKDFLISIHRGDIKEILNFLNECETTGKTKAECVKSPENLLYSILKSVFLGHFPIIDHISDDIDAIEANIFKGNEKEMVEEIMIVKRNIIALRRIISPHLAMMKSLETLSGDLWKNKMSIYLSDISDYVQRIWELLDNQRESIISLENTNETLISHKSSEIFRILTIFSSILLPMTLLASIYGMNMKKMPFLAHPDSFFIILGIMVFVGCLFLIYFRIKKWL